jgi:hypothetical protein
MLLDLFLFLSSSGTLCNKAQAAMGGETRQFSLCLSSLFILFAVHNNMK